MDSFDYPGYLDSDAPSEYQQRLDAEWIALSALRELVGIALKGARIPTYAQTLALCQHLMSKLFDPERSLLIRQQERLGARQYRQMAEAESEIRGEPVSALELVVQETERFERLVETRPDRDLLRRRLNALYRIRQELQRRNYSEQQLILRDVFRTGRDIPISGEGRDYREFELANDRVLRIRILHPDPPEHSTGADVIYEVYWDRRRMVRLAAIQYKVWDGETLYKSDNIASQLDRLHKTFCSNKLCEQFAESQRKDAYRLPYCSAFLRPTDKLQHPDSRFISSAYHIPVCVVERSWQDTVRGGQKIERKYFRSEAVTHRVFEELFNANMLGSKWLTYEELEKLYREHKILEADEHIIIHAQEFGV